MRRAHMRISPTVKSATASTMAPGVLVQTTPKRVAASTSTASYPTPHRATIFSEGQAAKTSALYVSDEASDASQPSSRRISSAAGYFSNRSGRISSQPASLSSLMPSSALDQKARDVAITLQLILADPPDYAPSGQSPA